ncbi:MAG: GNAT family N-acetyltransferase [Desulfovibrionaceae bacterium]|nr:GNAT family N-acetyltransferase [Desulfovibrionaceae bacterium]
MDAVLDIWIRASERAHAFVPSGFWRAQLDRMRDHYLPLAEVRVILWPKLAGFAAVVADHLTALFVAPEWQGRGLGRLLMEDARRRRNRLSLSVYESNRAARAFYEHLGFAARERVRDTLTGRMEWIMLWRRAETFRAGEQLDSSRAEV